jgi:hypothetical protein
VASYSAVIDVRVQGQNDLKAVADNVGRLESLIRKVKPVPNLFDRRATEDVKELKRGLENLVKAYADGNTRIAKFSSSIAGVSQQLSTFNAIAANAKVGSEQFTNALTAAARASSNLLTKELERFSTLQQIYQRQPTAGLSTQDQGPSKLVKDLIDLRNTVPNSVSALERYQRELLDVQNTVSMTSVEYRELAQAIRQTDVALGRGGQFGPAAPPVQGPRLPGNLGGGMNLPPGMQRMGKPPAAPAAGGIKGMLQKPGVADALIGGSFPLLFGGGPGAALGGAAGGFIGGAMGGPLGMALSLAMSAVGQQLDEAMAKIMELQKAINGLNVDALRESFIVVNAELDGTIRRLIEAGKYDEARAAAAEAVALQTGAVGTAVEDSANATNGLANSWNELVGTVSTTLSLLGAPFAAALALILEGVNLIAKGFNFLVSGVGQLLKSGVEKLIGLLPGGQQILKNIQTTVKGISEENEKIKAQAEAEIEAYDRKLGLAIRLEQIDKQRTTNVSLMGKLINLEADRQEKIANIQSTTEQKRIDTRTKLKGVDDALLKTLLGQIDAEEKNAIKAVDRANARQRELAITQEILARDQQRIALFQLEAQATAARQTAAAQITQAGIQQLEQRKGIASSLQAELGIINQIATAKTVAAQQTYEAAVREQTVAVETAALELQKVENQNARIGGMTREVELATQQYNTALQVRDAVIAGAQATEQAAISAANLEQRMSTLAAYAAEFGRATAIAKLALDAQLNTVNNTARLTNELANAYNTINNTIIAGLQAELQRNITTERRLEILGMIRDIEIINARNTLFATRAQIQAEVQRIVLAARSVELEYARAKALMQQAAAQGLLNEYYIQAVREQENALRIAYDNLAVAQQIAAAQNRAADAVFNSAVQAANLKFETESAAAAAGKYANNMTEAANALNTTSSSSGGTGNNQLSGTSVFFNRRTNILKAAPINNLTAEGLAQTRTNTLQSEAALTSSQTPSTLFSSTPDYGSTQSGASDTNINITTGPVVEFDGTKYVTLADLESAMRSTVSGIVGRLRTPSARIALGMS